MAAWAKLGANRPGPQKWQTGPCSLPKTGKIRTTSMAIFPHGAPKGNRTPVSALERAPTANGSSAISQEPKACVGRLYFELIGADYVWTVPRRQKPPLRATFDLCCFVSTLFGCGGQDLNLRPSGYEPDSLVDHPFGLELTFGNDGRRTERRPNRVTQYPARVSKQGARTDEPRRKFEVVRPQEISPD
jgi:hypothetical protein